MLKIHDFNKSVLVIDAYLCFIGILTTFHHPPLFIQRSVQWTIRYCTFTFFTLSRFPMFTCHLFMSTCIIIMSTCDLFMSMRIWLRFPALLIRWNRKKRGLASHSLRHLAWAYILQPFIVQWCRLYVSEITLSGMLNNRQIIIEQTRMLNCLNVSSIF